MTRRPKPLAIQVVNEDGEPEQSIVPKKPLGSDLANLVDKRDYRYDGTGESVWTPGFMERVARSIVARSISDAVEGRTVDIAGALLDAGCPTAMYAQMAADPEWRVTMERVSWGYTVGPRYPQMLNAMSIMAAGGDSKAFRELMSQRPEGIKESETDYIETMRKAGPEALASEILNLKAQLRELEDIAKSQVSIKEDSSVNAIVDELNRQAAEAGARLAQSVPGKSK